MCEFKLNFIKFLLIVALILVPLDCTHFPLLKHLGDFLCHNSIYFIKT